MEKEKKKKGESLVATKNIEQRFAKTIFFQHTSTQKKKFHHSIIIKNIKMKEEGVSDPSLSQEILQNKRSAVMPACVKVSPAVASFR